VETARTRALADTPLAAPVSTLADELDVPDASWGSSVHVNAAWMLGGTTVYSAAQWAAVACIAKLGSAELVGQYALGLAIAGPAVLLTNLNLRAVLATDARRQFNLATYTGARLLGILLFIAISVAISVLTRVPATALVVVLVVILLKAIEAYSDVLYGLLQREERHDLVARSLAVRSLAGLAVLVLIMWRVGDLGAALLAAAAAWLLAVIAFDVRFARRVGADAGSLIGRSAHSRSGSIRGLLLLAAPLGVVMLLGSLSYNAPRYTIQAFLGTEELGFFAALATLLLVGSTAVNALGQGAVPHLARLAAMRRKRSFKRYVLNLVLAAIGIGALAVTMVALWGEVILRFLFTGAYAVRTDIAIWIMVAGMAGLVSSVFGYALTACRAFRIQVATGLVSLLATIIMLLVWVPSNGIVGAAWALGVGYVVGACAKSVVLSHMLRSNLWFSEEPA
jgi:O-antigen/teichoic acid export membrane protein